MFNLRQDFRYIFIEMPEVLDISIKNHYNFTHLNYIHSFIKNISATGICIQTDAEIKKDSIIFITSKIKDKTFQWQAKFIWKKRINNNIYDYGLSFIKNSKQEQDRLRLIYDMQTKRRK